MLYKGYKITISCEDWEQVDMIDKFWNSVTLKLNSDRVIGLGMNWTEDGLYFDYALGVIEDDIILERLMLIDFSKYGFDAKYVEINLPDINEWETFRGLDKDIREIYENQVDCYNKKYDYELEYIDGKGNIEIKIHFC